jgi:hypothetical protein
MTAIVGEYTLAPKRQRRPVERCNHPLSNGRTCCHIKDAPAIGYEPCPFKGSYGPGGDDRCWHAFAKNEPHRHSHTWQLGDGRYGASRRCIVNLETGEVAGIRADDASHVIEDVKSGPFHYKPELDPGTQANARRILRLYGFTLPDDDAYAVPVDHITEAGIVVEWHYHGKSGWSYGTDQDGHNYEMSPDGKLKRIYALNERREAVLLAQRFGPTKASRKFGIPLETVRSWSKRGL